MNDETLRSIGKLVEGAPLRDAVHIAVIPLMNAGGRLHPGEYVIRGKEEGTALGTHRLDWAAVGVVDPFLQKPVETGERFWAFLRPLTITSLRHLWTHPLFPLSGASAEIADAEAKDNARAFITARAESEGVSFDEVYRCAIQGNQVTVNFDCHVSMDDEFWAAVETLSGRKFDQGHRDDTYFSCSC